MKKEIGLLELFFTFLKVNAVTFGGGYTIVAVLRDEFVLKKKLINEDEMLDLIALAQSGPGAMAINTSILTGYRLRGPLGAFTCMLASVLPSLFIITLVSYFYQEFRSNYYVNGALRGMAGVIAAVLIITTYNMGKNALGDTPIFSGLLMISAFVLGFVFNLNAGLIVIVFGVMGIVLFSIVKEEGPGEGDMK